MKKIFIIVLKFNGEKEINDCLKSLQLIKVPKGWQKEVLVIDNSKKNLGFAKGMNVGIRRAIKNGAEAVLLLNQDTVVEKNFLAPLLENSADIVGPVIKFKRHEKWIYDFGGKVNWWVGRTSHIEEVLRSPTESFDSASDSLAKRRTLLNKVIGARKVKPHKIWRAPRTFIDYVSGCAMLIKRPVLEKIGLLDERYFLYFEDADFCLRAKKGGFRVAVEPKSLIFHKLIEGRKKPLKQRLHFLKSNLIFINRWISFWKKPIAYLYWWMLMFKILLR